MLSVAVPAAFNVPVPRMVDPLRKVTLPEGTEVPDLAASVAVKVMLCPVLICVAEDIREVVVATAACATLTVTAAETDCEFAGLPP